MIATPIKSIIIRVSISFLFSKVKTATIIASIAAIIKAGVNQKNAKLGIFNTATQKTRFTIPNITPNICFII